jgi:nucleotide-binding universal stress UspA family protein
MFDTILVPLDGSEHGEQALPLATKLARMSGAQLLLVRASDGSATDQAEAHEYLTQKAEALTQSGVATQTFTPVGAATEAVVAEIDRQQPSLVVITTHGRTGIGRMIFGSVAEAILVHSHSVVLLVRGDAPDRLASLNPGETKILVPLDGSMNAEHALNHATPLAIALDAGMVLLRVIVADSARMQHMLADKLTDEITSLEVKEARDYLTTHARRLEALEMRVETVLKAGDPADTIIEHSKAPGVSIIVMSTRGQRGLKQIFGSVSLDVLRRGTDPVLVVHPITHEHA